MSTKIIISGGGTGGHIFPAVSIAQEIKQRMPETNILFVGAKGGMEMNLVPKYGFDIEAVWVSGIHRKLTSKNLLKNLLFPVKLLVSLLQARQIMKRFKPTLVVGVGGFASGPIGRVAAYSEIPLVICEQNAFPGLVNRWLAPKASKILLGNSDAAKYFDPKKTIVTGNPIRSFPSVDKQGATAKMGLNPEKKILLSLGGSLGAFTLNKAIQNRLEEVRENKVQLVWQCGKRYYEHLQSEVKSDEWIHLKPFINDMAAAYASADLVISRAGGSTISELIALSKPSILVPSPNVAEDHQTKNALSLSEKGAAILVKDDEAEEKLIHVALSILNDQTKISELKNNIKNIEKHDSAKEIVDVLFELLDNK